MKTVKIDWHIARHRCPAQRLDRQLEMAVKKGTTVAAKNGARWLGCGCRGGSALSFAGPSRASPQPHSPLEVPTGQVGKFPGENAPEATERASSPGDAVRPQAIAGRPARHLRKGRCESASCVATSTRWSVTDYREGVERSSHPSPRFLPRRRGTSRGRATDAIP